MFKRDDVPLTFVLVSAAALRVWGISYGLPHTLTRPDEEAVFGIALRFFGRNLNPQFFDWPSLFMYAVAAAFVVYFNIGRFAGWFGREAAFLTAATTHPAPLFLIARGLSAAAGTATVATVYRIGTHLFDRATALVAALFVAVAALHVRESHFGLTDVAATWLLTTSFLYTVRYSRSGTRRDAMFAALAAGLAASTKYNAAIVILPLGWAVVSRKSVEGPAHRAHLIMFCGIVACVAFAAGTPYALLDASDFLAAIRAVGAHLRGGHAALAGYAWRIHLTSSLRYGLGLPMLIAGVGGMCLLIVRNRRDGVLLLLGPLAYFALIGAGQTAFARYVLPMVPFLCVAAAYLTVHAAAAVSRWSARPAAAPTLAWIVAALIAAPSLFSAIATDRLLARDDNRLVAAAWLREHFPGGSTLFQTGSIYGHVQMQREGLLPDERYPEVSIDGTPAPKLIVVPRCPLEYCDVPSDLDAALVAYTALQSFPAADMRDPALVYDRDDAFFVPLSGFRAVTRGGPNLEIYERRTSR